MIIVEFILRSIALYAMLMVLGLFISNGLAVLGIGLILYILLSMIAGILTDDETDEEE